MTTPVAHIASDPAPAAFAVFSALDGWFDIFRSGTHTDAHGRDATWTPADLAGIVADYAGADPAPVVLGHPETDAPAMGWVRGLRVMGDRLQARIERLDPGFREAVEAGRYAPRSVALAPTPAGWRLRHLGFLGAQNPAVEGLAPSQFSARADGVLVFSCPHSESAMTEPFFTSVRAQPQPAMQPGQAQFTAQPALQPQPAMQPGQAQLTAQPAQVQVTQVQPVPVQQQVAEQTLPQPQFVTPAQPDQGQLVPLFAANPPAGALPPYAGSMGVAATQAGARYAAEAADLARERQQIFAERQQMAAERLARQSMDRERDAGARVAAHVHAGRIVPSEAQAYTAVFCALDEGGGRIAMAGVDGRPTALTPSAVLDGLLSALPRRVPLEAAQAQPIQGQGFQAQFGQGGLPGRQTSQEGQFAAATQDLANRARALMAADKSGTLDLPTAIRRAASGEQAQ